MSPDSDFEHSKCHVVHILNDSVLDIYQIMRINLSILFMKRRKRGGSHVDLERSVQKWAP